MRKLVAYRSIRHRFWERFTLEELNSAEWEALCDGCGLCCLLKIDNKDSEIAFTNVSCKLLDCGTCRCKHYQRRNDIVRDCIPLTIRSMQGVLDWMPSTCAYKLLHDGQPLHHWHYLISGSRETVHDVGISAKNRCIPEYEICMDKLESYVVDWGKS